jgi:hypothetical protein
LRLQRKAVMSDLIVPTFTKSVKVGQPRDLVFRYNHRGTKDAPINDADRFELALSQIAGKRLTFAEVTGKVGKTTF